MDLAEITKRLDSMQRFCRNTACGKRFYLKFEGDISKYCSEECHADHLKFRRLRRKKREEKQKNKRVTKKKQPSFYYSEAWMRLRYEAFKRLGRVCKVCGATPPTPLHVDHIQPRSKAPHRSLDPTNLQILCKACNLGKSNRDEIAW